jgi:flagella basal body P-ring formation protein FlgA
MSSYFANYSISGGGAYAAKELYNQYKINKLDGDEKIIKKEKKKKKEKQKDQEQYKAHTGINDKFVIGTINRSELRKTAPRE